MTLVDSKINFHDAQLADFSVGPRREVILRIVLDPVWNQTKQVVVRFGAIENMQEVVAYFGELAKPADSESFVAEIEHLGAVQNGAATLGLASRGTLTIRSKKIVIE